MPHQVLTGAVLSIVVALGIAAANFERPLSYTAAAFETPIVEAVGCKLIRE